MQARRWRLLSATEPCAEGGTRRSAPKRAHVPCHERDAHPSQRYTLAQQNFAWEFIETSGVEFGLPVEMRSTLLAVAMKQTVTLLRSKLLL